MKAKQATVKPKPVSQLVKHACFCPPTKHDTKLDQLNKAKEKQALTRQSPRQATSKRVMKPCSCPSNFKATKSNNNAASDRSRESLSNAFARHGNVASRVAFPVAGLPFFFFFLGGKDIHYTSATITTSKKCDVHCKTNKAEANNTS